MLNVLLLTVWIGSTDAREYSECSDRWDYTVLSVFGPKVLEEKFCLIAVILSRILQLQLMVSKLFVLNLKLTN